MRSCWARAVAGATLIPRPSSEAKAVPEPMPAADARTKSRRESGVFMGVRSSCRTLGLRSEGVKTGARGLRPQIAPGVEPVEVFEPPVPDVFAVVHVGDHDV